MKVLFCHEIKALGQIFEAFFPGVEVEIRSSPFFPFQREKYGLIIVQASLLTSYFLEFVASFPSCPVVVITGGLVEEVPQSVCKFTDGIFSVEVLSSHEKARAALGPFLMV